MTQNEQWRTLRESLATAQDSSAILQAADELHYAVLDATKKLRFKKVTAEEVVELLEKAVYKMQQVERENS